MLKHLISVVDDDESICKSTSLLIESFGFEAAAFESAESLLKSSQLHETSCLIIDLRMPGVNGWQLQSHLAAAGYKIPIIFITAYDNNESRQQAIQAGALAFLAKRSEEHTSELQSPDHLVCRLLLEKKKQAPLQRVQRR